MWDTGVEYLVRGASLPDVCTAVRLGKAQPPVPHRSEWYHLQNFPKVLALPPLCQCRGIRHLYGRVRKGLNTGGVRLGVGSYRMQWPSNEHGPRAAQALHGMHSFQYPRHASCPKAGKRQPHTIGVEDEDARCIGLEHHRRHGLPHGQELRVLVLEQGPHLVLWAASQEGTSAVAASNSVSRPAGAAHAAPLVMASRGASRWAEAEEQGRCRVARLWQQG